MCSRFAGVLFMQVFVDMTACARTVFLCLNERLYGMRDYYCGDIVFTKRGSSVSVIFVKL